MAVRFRTFSFRDTRTVQKPKVNMWGLPTGELVPAAVAAYRTTDDLYAAVAAFADGVGDRLVSISGTPWAESTGSYMAGEVVVWYRE